jgi:hypothetical protein
VPLATNAFLEDYNADFLVMLESWQTAEKFLTGGARQKLDGIEVARLLGWNRGGRESWDAATKFIERV